MLLRTKGRGRSAQRLRGSDATGKTSGALTAASAPPLLIATPTVPSSLASGRLSGGQSASVNSTLPSADTQRLTAALAQTVPATSPTHNSNCDTLSAAFMIDIPL